MASQRSKQVEVKLGVDGDTIRLRFSCKGHLATESFPSVSDTTLNQKQACMWLAEQFDEQLTKLKEAANGASR